MATVGSSLVGTQGTLTINGQDLLPDIQTKLIEHDLESSPVVTIMSRIPGGMVDTVNPTYQWIEVQYDEPSVTCSTGIAIAGANISQVITVDTLAVVVGDSFLEPTSNQLFEVFDVPSQDVAAGTSDITIKQIPTSTATVAVAGTPMMIRMGNTFIEGGFYPTPILKKPLRVTNTITEVAAQIEITDLMDALPTYYGPDFEFQKKYIITRFRCDMERRCIWGKQFEEVRTQAQAGGTATGMARGTKGIWNGITSNITPYVGTITESTLDTWLGSTVFGAKYSGSPLKMAFCGTNFLSGVSQFVKNKVRVLNSVPTYGLSISEYVAPFGGYRLYLIAEREFKGNPSYLDTAMVIDPAYLKLRKVANRPLITVKPSNVQNKDTKAIAIRAYFGVQLEAEVMHSILKH